MTSPETSAQNSYESILAAAEDVVRESGAVHLTLDAVAARAGVSKGGLLYHFRNKEALIKAMLERLPLGVLEYSRQLRAALPAGPGRNLKAVILAADEILSSGKMQGLSTSLLAAAYDPSLFESLRENRVKLVDEYSATGLSKSFVNVIFLALEGLWIVESLKIATPDPKQRESDIAQLLSLVDAEERRLMSHGENKG